MGAGTFATGPAVTLQGAHVILERLRPEHAHELWPAASERELWAYMGQDAMGVDSEQALRTWIERRIAGEPSRLPTLPFLLRDAASGQAFGSTSLFDIDVPNLRAEVGHTWVGASHRRTPANTEAKRLILGHAFEALHLNRVQLKCDARNQRSRAAILRIGASFEGILRQWLILPDGHRRDTAFYSILASEWPAVRDRLDAMLAPR